jgi:hypothetical protein
MAKTSQECHVTQKEIQAAYLDASAKERHSYNNNMQVIVAQMEGQKQAIQDNTRSNQDLTMAILKKGL